MLIRKLWRDIKQNYGAYVACISVIVIGMMFYVSMSLMLEKMVAQQDWYYRTFRFADGFAQIKRGPRSLANALQAVPGIDKTAGRLVSNVFVYKTGNQDTTTLRLVSYTDKQEVNGFFLKTGRKPSPGRRQLVVSPMFLNANKLAIGDKIPLIMQGKVVEFVITGTAQSPEFIYEIPNGQTILPDSKAFGVAYVPYDTIAPLLGMSGQINDLVFTLAPPVKFSQVKNSVERLLNDYGMTQLVPRKDQVSHSVFSSEITQLKGSVNTTPIIFLSVAAGILYIMLRRMVEQQRGQIGLLKAFGFKESEILAHYLSYAALLGVVGGLLGGLAGSGMSYVFGRLYQQYYNIPGLSGSFSPGLIATGTLLSLAFSLVAGYQGCKGMLRLSPAEAMRPPAPKGADRTWLERIRALWAMLNTTGKMAVRNVARSKQRSTIAILGVAFAFALVGATSGSFDSMDFMINYQYGQVERYDLKVGLRGFADASAGASAVVDLPGVRQAQPILELPVSISHKWRKKDLVITGLPDESPLYRVLDDRQHHVALPESSLVISNQLAKMMDIKPGDTVTIKPYVGDTKERQLRVTRVVSQYVGLGAYMRMAELSRVMGEPPMASSILVQGSVQDMAAVHRKLQEGKNVASIQDKSKMKAQFETLMESAKAEKYIGLIFAFITGFAIVYNVNLISLSEREREMATMMVLGMTEQEVARIILWEQVLLGITAVALGIPLTYGLIWAIANGTSNEMYNIPVVIKSGSLMMGLLGTVGSLLAAQLKMKGKIGRLSMLDVLKQQD